MKLKLRRAERRTGFITKKTEYELHVSLKLNDEERAAWGECKETIKDHIIARNKVKGMDIDHNLKAGRLVDSEGEFLMVFSDLAQLSQKETEVKEGVNGLSTYLKDIGSAGSSTGTEEIEL